MDYADYPILVLFGALVAVNLVWRLERRWWRARFSGACLYEAHEHCERTGCCCPCHTMNPIPVGRP